MFPASECSEAWGCWGICDGRRMCAWGSCKGFDRDGVCSGHWDRCWGTHERSGRDFSPLPPLSSFSSPFSLSHTDIFVQTYMHERTTIHALSKYANSHEFRCSVLRYVHAHASAGPVHIVHIQQCLNLSIIVTSMLCMFCTVQIWKQSWEACCSDSMLSRSDSFLQHTHASGVNHGFSVRACACRLIFLARHNLFVSFISQIQNCCVGWTSWLWFVQISEYFDCLFWGGLVRRC